MLTVPRSPDRTCQVQAEGGLLTLLNCGVTASVTALLTGPGRKARAVEPLLDTLLPAETARTTEEKRGK